VKCIVVILLTANITWLANAAALEQADQQAVAQQPTQPAHEQDQKKWLFEDLPAPANAQIIQYSHPKIVKFLERCYADKMRQEIPNYNSECHFFAISPYDAKLAIFPNSAGMIIWDLATMREVHHKRIESPIHYGGFTPDGQKLITTNSKKEVSIWDMRTANKFDLDCILTGRMALIAMDQNWLPSTITLSSHGTC